MNLLQSNISITPGGVTLQGVILMSKLKSRLSAEGNEVVTKCDHLKMISPDGKMRLTDVAVPD